MAALSLAVAPRTIPAVFIAASLSVLAWPCPEAPAAERRVMMEAFTATWCVYCPPVRQAYSDLCNEHPGSFFTLGIHGGDSYATPWGNQRQSFYGVPGYPTTWMDGTLQRVGSAGSASQNYAVLSAQYQQRLLAPTDVTVQLGAVPAGTNKWEVTMRVGIEPGGSAKTLRLHLVQALDQFPTGGNPMYRNTFIQAPNAVDIALLPGQFFEHVHTFTLSGASASNLGNVRFLGWAQSNTAAAPSQIFNAHWISHPFPTFDCNANGIPDSQDIAAGTSQDCNQNGLPDECDIASGSSADANGNGVPDECGDCNSNGTMDWQDLLSGASQDCNANGIPDECDIASAVEEDCNGNLVPDSCEVARPFVRSSPQYSPFGFGSSYTYTIANPSTSVSDVHFTVFGQGDFAVGTERLNITVNGTLVGQVFINGLLCAPMEETLIVPAATWNALVDGQPSASVLLTATGAVDANACGGATWVRFDLSLTLPGDSDADSNGLVDACEKSPCPTDQNGSGSTDFADVLVLLAAWGPCADCPEDLDGNGTVDFSDVLATLAAWGPCP